MSVEENKAAVRRWLDALNRGDLSDAVADDFVHDVRYYHAPPGLPPGKEGYRVLFRSLLTGFPDLRITLDALFGEGEDVCGRLTATGTHTGEFMGIPPTGKQARVTSVSHMRFRHGKVSEEWENVDKLGLLTQLGVVTAPAQPPA